MKDKLQALVVDDDDFVRGVVAQQLVGLGAERVCQAGDGAQARHALSASGPFDVIVCDLVMPGSDGVELLREIAELQPYAGLILVSSVEPRLLRSAELLAQARALRVLGSLRKPVSRRALGSLLERLGHELPALAMPTAAARATIHPDELHAAIATGQLYIEVQPEVGVHDFSLHCVEALARWRHPVHGQVPPDQFIPMAENAGLIGALTDFVLRRAVAVCGEWAKQGVRTRIAINVAVAALDRLDLPDQVAALAAAHGIGCDQIVVEVTETGLMGDLTVPLDILTRLRMRGVDLAIDDFGVGYSSLVQLSRLPFTELKIDRSFIAGALERTESRRIVESSVRLAHSLGLRTIAEGVETPQQLQLLDELGCDFAQGYLIARPMPCDALVGWLRQLRRPH